MKEFINIWLDLTSLIFETIVISSFSKLVFTNGTSYLLSETTSIDSNQNYEQLIRLASAILQFLILVVYLSVRYCFYFSIPNVKTFIRKTFTGKSIYPSSQTLQVSLVHGISFLLLCVYQEYVIKEWKYYSFDNYNLHNNTAVIGASKNIKFELDYAKSINMIFLNPIKEEFLFRLTVVSILCYRLNNKVNGVMLSSVLFGLLHFANFFSLKSEYASSYVYLQCVFAFLIGIFYALEMILTENLLNVILLHIVNNVFASFVPIHRSIDLNDPVVTFLLLVTICIYSCYCYHGYQRLVRKLNTSIENDVIEKNSKKKTK